MSRQTNIQVRRGLASAWFCANPILAAGEPGFETDTRKFKIGDGTTAWNSLEYVKFDGGNLDAGAFECSSTSSGESSSSSSSSSSFPTSCPAPWMKILLSDGSLVPAGELETGMMVKTNHESTMELGSYSVTHVSVVQAERLQINIGDLEFVCSKSHKFYIDGSWVEAENLSVGDHVGSNVVSSIEDIGLGDVVKITVDSAHTYICEGLLSHNKSLLVSSSTQDPYPGFLNSNNKFVSW